jgi:hypothetical protein
MQRNTNAWLTTTAKSRDVQGVRVCSSWYGVHHITTDSLFTSTTSNISTNMRENPHLSLVDAQAQFRKELNAQLRAIRYDPYTSFEVWVCRGPTESPENHTICAGDPLCSPEESLSLEPGCRHNGPRQIHLKLMTMDIAPPNHTVQWLIRSMLNVVGWFGHDAFLNLGLAAANPGHDSMEQATLNRRFNQDAPLHRELSIEDSSRFEVLTRKAGQGGRWTPFSISLDSRIRDAGLDFMLRVPDGKSHAHGSACMLLIASTLDFPLCPRAFQLPS